MADAVSGRQLVAVPTAVGVRSINFFDLTGPDNSSAGWGLQVGVQRSNTEGTPSAPSLLLAQPGAWRFRWQVVPGSQTISVWCKQVVNTSPYPSMMLKANPDIGFAADVETSAAAGVGWKKIGPVTATVSTPGVLWVELRANLRTQGYATSSTPWELCHFDLVGP